MCILCGELVMNVHWTDQPTHDKEFKRTVVVGELQRDRMRDRLRRAFYVNQILSYYGLSLKDWGGSRYILADKKGRQEIVNDLGDMWPKAQQMANGRLDPLDPGLLAYLPTCQAKTYRKAGAR